MFYFKKGKFQVLWNAKWGEGSNIKKKCTARAFQFFFPE